MCKEMLINALARKLVRASARKLVVLYVPTSDDKTFLETSKPIKAFLRSIRTKK